MRRLLHTSASRALAKCPASARRALLVSRILLGWVFFMNTAAIVQHLKTPALARLLDLHPETLRRAAQRGELDPIRIGHDLIWPVNEVQAWLDRNRTHSRVTPIRRQDRSSTTRRSA